MSLSGFSLRLMASTSPWHTYHNLSISLSSTFSFSRIKLIQPLGQECHQETWERHIHQNSFLTWKLAKPPDAASQPGSQLCAYSWYHAPFPFWSFRIWADGPLYLAFLMVCGKLWSPPSASFSPLVSNLRFFCSVPLFVCRVVCDFGLTWDYEAFRAWTWRRRLRSEFTYEGLRQSSYE